MREYVRMCECVHVFSRSLTVVIEQMEQFSRRLGDLSSRVESTHEHTTQGLELGARQRDEQLRGVCSISLPLFQCDFVPYICCHYIFLSTSCNVFVYS